MKSLNILLGNGETPADKLFLFWNLYAVERSENPALPELLNIVDAFTKYESDIADIYNGKRYRMIKSMGVGVPYIHFSFIKKLLGGFECYTDIEWGETFNFETIEEVEIALILWQAVFSGILDISRWPFWMDQRNNPGFENLLCSEN